MLFSMVGRAALVIPSIAAFVTAAVLLGPGATRPAIGARLRGAPIEGGRVVALRLEAIKRFYGVDEGVALTGLKLEATAGGQALETWTGETGSDGIAEVRLSASAPVHGPLEVRIAREGAALLGQGTIPLRRGAPVFATLGTIQGTVVAAAPAGGLGPTPGDLSIRVDATRGVLAAPFPATLRVSIGEAEDSRTSVRAELEISALGAELSPDGGVTAASPLKLSTDARGLAELTVKPLAHQVELTILARATEKSARWVGSLPVTPGALWIAPPGKPDAPMVITSPSPRERAYLSFFSEEGRVFGAVVALSRDPQGFFQAEVTPVLPPSPRILYVTVAGDPLEQGLGTVAFPLHPSEGAVAPRPLELLFDGVPAAEVREKVRAWTARRAGLMVVGAAAVLSMLLILLRSRQAQRRLDAHLIAASTAKREDGAGEAPPLSGGDRAKLLAAAREQPVLRALIAAAVVGLAFSVMAAVSAFR